MMSGRLYIDGVDVYKQYGVYVSDNGWNELVAMPPLKTVDSNDWQEEDGIEADLSSPVLNTREVNITFATQGVYSRFFHFVERGIPCVRLCAHRAQVHAKDGVACEP